MNIFRSNQRGDTIMEVLISVAVLSLVLTSSFALANRSTQGNRQAAERSEALKIAQAEMEKLKLYLSTPDATLPAAGSYFCMNDDASALIVFFGAPAQDLSSGYRPECTPTTPGDLYYRYIQRGTGAGLEEANTYTSIVRWPAVTGNGIDQSSMVHRIYRP